MLLVGLTTFVRVADVSIEDVAIVAGMNRLRHAYVEIAPELEPYFVTGTTDDEEGVLKTLGHSLPIEVGGVTTTLLLALLATFLTPAAALRRGRRRRNDVQEDHASGRPWSFGKAGSR